MTTLILITVSQWVLMVISRLGYAGIVLLSILGSMNIPVPSEVVLPFSGFLAAQGILSFWGVVFAGAIGNTVGALSSYGLGYLVRNNRKIRESERVQLELVRAHAWTDRYGDWAVLISCMLPLVRSFFAFPFGIIKVDSLRRFGALVFTGMFIWSFVLAKAGVLLGEHWAYLGQYFRKFDSIIMIMIVLILGIWIWSHFLKNNGTKKGTI